jgi:regulatory protein
MPARRRTESVVFRDGVITALVALGGKSGRIGVNLDGHFALDLSAVVADRAGLRAGDTLSADRQHELVEQDAPYRARERALRFLAVRDRSRREVEVRLRQAGFEPTVVVETVVWLTGLGYVDDRRFAMAYAAEKQRTGWGVRRTRAELASKGVERSIIDEVLELQEAESAGAAEGTDALEQMVRKRFGSQFAADPEAAERRLAGFLARRGYDWDTIGRMARTLWVEAAGVDDTRSVEPGSSGLP